MTKSTRVTNVEYEMLAGFRAAIRKFLNFSEEAAKALALTPQQHQALLAIKGFGKNGRIQIKDLAQQLQIRHNSAVGLVDRLVAVRLVSRVQNADDRRCVEVALSSRGMDVLEKLSYAHKNELKRMAPKLNALLRRLAADSDIKQD